jgi:hypothetical protein
MQPNSDDLTTLERHLGDCRPAAAGLDADAMLFAAGQAAALKARGTNWAWPAATFAFAMATALLGTALVGERSERLALAERLVRRSATPETPAPTAVASTEPPAADSYFAARRMIDSDSDLFTKPDAGSGPTPAPAAEPPTLRAWMPDDQH